MAKNSYIAECALCGKIEKLCNSHILPLFFWELSGAKKPQKRIEIQCLNNPELNYSEQDGFKKHLLCLKCETQFNKYETYAKRIFFDQKIPLIYSVPLDLHLSKSFIDYFKMKLFSMSVLWRMGVCNIPFYDQIKLGKHQEILRKMLLAEEPGENWRYGCQLSLIKDGDKFVAGFGQPRRLKIDGTITCYETFIAHLMWRFFVTSHNPDPKTAESFLSVDGNWTIFRTKKSEMTYFTKPPRLTA